MVSWLINDYAKYKPFPRAVAINLNRDTDDLENFLKIKPSKNIVLMSSALESARGIISKEDRSQQTIDTIENVKTKYQIVSYFFQMVHLIYPLKRVEKLYNQWWIFLFGWHNEQIKQLAAAHKNSEAESCLLAIIFITF